MTITAQAIGNLTRAPELRFTNGGSATCSFGMACSRRYQSNGEWVEATTFINVVAWAGLAENIAATLTKGDRVVVTGRLDVREYEPKDGSGKRTITELVADEVGPSLKWATGTVSRTERSGPQDRASAQGESRGGTSGGRSNPLPDGEEPFIVDAEVSL